MPDYPIVEQAAKLLRRHGVNAYEQEGELVLFVADSHGWVEVERFESNTIDDVNGWIYWLLTWLYNNITGEHTHEED